MAAEGMSKAQAASACNAFCPRVMSAASAALPTLLTQGILRETLLGPQLYLLENGTKSSAVGIASPTQKL